MSRYKVYADPDWLTPSRVRKLFGVTPVILAKATAQIRRNTAWPLLQLEEPDLQRDLYSWFPSGVQSEFNMRLFDAMAANPKIKDSHWHHDFFPRWFIESVRPKDGSMIYRWQCLFCLDYIYMPVSERSYNRSTDQRTVPVVTHLLHRHAAMVKELGLWFAQGALRTRSFSGEEIRLS